MRLRLTPALANDVTFAHDVARASMEPYYRAMGRAWDESVFRDSWTDTTNMAMVLDGARKIGILRLSEDDKALFVRDI